jgi:recombinational DNA repair protein RecT
MQRAVIAEEEERDRIDITPLEENEVIDAEFTEAIPESTESDDPFEGEAENGQDQGE